MADLSPEQRKLVETWASEGANLNQIQDRLRHECSVTLTYMEARLLLMDLNVKLQDKPREAPKPAEEPPPAPAEAPVSDAETAADAPKPAGELKITVDEVPLQGALISGEASFSDGEVVVWFMDQMGRFGMRGPFQGYQPPAADIPKFEQELDQLLRLRGL
jgi:hypothetical protein